MKRRFFILLTAAVLAFLLLPASVSADPGDPEETKTVTEAINLAADDTSRSGSGWAWDSSTKTLVLNGLDLDLSSAGGYTSGISLPGGAVRIVLQGSNYIRVSGAGHNGISAAGPLLISGAEASLLRIDAGDGANGLDAGGALDIQNARIMSFGADYGIHCGTLSLTHTVLSAEAETGIAVRMDPAPEVMSKGPLFSILDEEENITTSLDLYGARGALLLTGKADDDFMFGKCAVIPAHMGDPAGGSRFDGLLEGDTVYLGFTEYGFVLDEDGELLGAADYAQMILLHARELYLDIETLTVYTGDKEVPGLEAIVFPQEAIDTSVTWHSEDPSVVEVVDAGVSAGGRAQGKLVIKGLGTTRVAAVANDDTDILAAGFCEVTVTDTCLYIGGTAVKKSGQVAEGISYDAETNTLTLDHAVLDGRTIGSNPAVIYCEGFRDFTGIEYAEGNALVTYSRKDPLKISVKGKNVFNAGGIGNGIGIAIEPYAAGDLVLTGPVSICGEDGASLEFVDCSLAAYAGSDNYLPPEGSTEEEEVPNLLLENITVKAEDLGTYGILSGRGTTLTNVDVSVANKELFGIRTGNLLMMTDVDIRVRDIGHTGIYASGSGYFMRSGILKVVNTGNTGLAAPSIGHIEGGGIIIDNSGMAMTGGQYFSMEGGTLTITNAEYGLFSSLTGSVSGGSIRIDAEGFAMNTGKTVVSGGDIVLHSENGFALLAAGQGDRTAGFTMEGGTIDARSEGHAAFLSVYGVNFWDPQEILLPEGGKFMSEDLEDLGVRIITITDKDTEKVSVDYVYTYSGPQILDIEGGADHVILKPMINEYEVISGDGSTWAKGSPDGLEIVIRGEPEDGKTFDRFMYAFLDQAMLDSDNFEVKEGSLVLTLKPGYLETLSEGEHHLKVVFSDDGAAEAVFTVTAGGESWIWYAAALALAALICIFLGKNLATLS